jgi:O-antigen/teichoic acid export membrane protein
MASTLANLGWKFMERMSAQLVQMIVSIVLARILSLSDYGAVAMFSIFVVFANVIIDGGFSSALIQKKDADDKDFSTVLYFSIFCSVLLYIVLYLVAPCISSFYGEGYAILIPVLRVLGIQVIIFAINSVQQAYVQKQMMFRNFFWATLVGTICSAVVGLSMAYLGYGIWSIVYQQLTATIVNTFTLYAITRKRPTLDFSFSRLSSLFAYGVKLLGANVLITGYQEIRALIIGKVYAAQDLAYFDRGKQFPSLVVTNINSSIGAVLFPKMANEQDDTDQIRQTTRQSIRFCSYLMSPLMLGLAAVSEPFVRLVLTEKWLGCVSLMQWFCVVFLFMPIHTANMQALKAIGRSDTCFNLEILKKLIEMLALLAVVWISVEAIVINMAILSALFTIVNAYPNRKLLCYSYKEQFMDICPSLLMGVGVFAAILLFNHYVVWADAYTLFADAVIGGLVYVCLSILTRNREFGYMLSLLKRYHER